MSLTKPAARILAALALAVLLAYSFRGAGSGGRSGLTLLIEPYSLDMWRELTGQFNGEFPGPPIQLIEGPRSTDTREEMYSTAFLAGEAGFDIVFIDISWLAKFAAAGWLLDLTPRISAEDRRALLSAELAGSSYQGRLYRMPALTDVGVLYYRTDLMAQPPETFDDLLRLARAHQTPERWGYLWQGRQYEGLVTVFLEVLWGFGGDWIDTSSRRVMLDSPEATRAVEFLKSTVGTVSPAAVTTYDEEDTRNVFQNGRAVFMRNWPYAQALMEEDSSPVRGRFALAPMVHAPGRKSGPTLGGWGFAISSFCPDPDRAWQFIEWITRPAQLRVFQQRQGKIPARRDMAPPEFLPILEAARPRPPIPEYAPASDILQRWLSAALTGRATPADAMHAAAAETRSLLAQ